MTGWAAFRRTFERHMRTDRTLSNYRITFCGGCEAHDRYKAAVLACGGDCIAISKIVGLPAAEPLPGRWDRMGPHLNKCRFADPSFVATGAGGCSSVRSGGSAAAPACSSPIEVQMIDEEALRAQLCIAFDDSSDTGSQGQPAP